MRNGATESVNNEQGMKLKRMYFVVGKNIITNSTLDMTKDELKEFVLKQVEKVAPDQAEMVKQNIDVDATSLAMLRSEFPEMTDAEASKLATYALYQNSDKGDVKGVQLNLSANVTKDLNISANYVYTYARTMSDDEWTALERSIRHAATIAVNYHHAWRNYGLNVNLNGRLQSKTYYSDYEDAPGYGIWNLNTTHSFNCLKWASFKPSIGIDNIFNKVDRRIDSTNRRYALYSPGRMLVVGAVFKLFVK